MENRLVLEAIFKRLEKLNEKNDELLERLGITKEMIEMEFAEVNVALDRIEYKLKDHDVRLKAVK